MKMKKKCRTGLVIKNSETGLVISRRWFGFKTVLCGLTASVYFFVSIKLMFSFSIIDENLFILVAIYVISTAFLAYMLVASFLNSTRIILDQDLLELVQWPIPFPGNRVIPASEISYLYIRNNIDGKNTPKNVNYEIRALTLGGRDMKIIDGLHSSSQAGRIKKKIAGFLKLVDIPSSEHALNLCR